MAPDRKGPLSVPAGQAGLFARALPDSATPDLQFLFQTFSGGYYEDGLFKFSGFANFSARFAPKAAAKSPSGRRTRSTNPGCPRIISPTSVIA